MDTRIAAAVMFLGLVSPTLAQAANHVFATEVREVRASTMGGNPVLTLEIDDITGPVGCQSTTVLLESSNPVNANLEAIALRALISSEAVVISVPIEYDGCVNGKPTVADMWILAYE